MNGEAAGRQLADETPDERAALGWLPVRLRGTHGESTLEWRAFGDRRLTEPFFDDAVAAVSALDPQRLISTPLSDPARWPARGPSLEPHGLIFHMSRCGSTLVAQMLAACDANIVISEPSPIDAVVRSHLGEAARIGLLREMAAAFGQVRRPGQARYFIKLDSWLVCALPLLRRAFPQTPWVFLYREPAAVLVSHARQTGMQMIPDLVPPAFLGFQPHGPTHGADYFGQVLAAICDAAARGYAEGGGLLVNYNELPHALWTGFLPHFAVTPSPEEVSAMTAAARFDAKFPDAPFTPDTEKKRQAATPQIETTVARLLASAYRKLEALRRGERSGGDLGG